MKKILFTDLFGTLISPSESIAKKYYGSIEKEISLVCNYLNEFLKDGNYIAIVTEPGRHNNFGKVFNRILTDIDSCILDNLRDNVTYYLQGKGKISIEDNIIKKELNGKQYYIGANSVKAIAIDKKDEAINDFIESINEKYQIYCIGDSEFDIPMLLKSQELLGNSAIIHTYLNRENRTKKQIIENALYSEYHFQMIKLIEGKNAEEVMLNPVDKQQLELLKEREERKQKLYNLLDEGKLDLDMLNKNYSKAMICEMYRSLNFIGKSNFYENYPFNEQVRQSVMDMSCYSSFDEYYSKVLKKER